MAVEDNSTAFIGAMFPGSPRSAEVVVVGNALSHVSRSLYLGVTGDVTVQMAGTGSSIPLKGLAAGIEHPMQILKVISATATDMVSFY